MGIREPVRVVVDRPFLFVLTTHGIPLFAGVVTQP
jgi:serine protease inhibitor